MRRLLIIGVIILIVGFGAYTLSQKPSGMDSDKKTSFSTKELKEDTGADESRMEDSDNKTMDEPTEDTNTPRYIEYSKSALDSSANNRRVLYFYANWCPICRPADIDFQQNENKIPEDVTVIRVNYDDTDTDQEEKALANKYGITYQHTFVQIDSQGNEVTKWNGGKLEELLENIK
jgi:thiol-disulfide isomerase/thioredoxin